MDLNKKDLKHMRRSELLEMLLLQSKEIDRLRSVVEETRDSVKSGDDPPKAEINVNVVKLMNLYMDQSEYVEKLRKRIDELQQQLAQKEITLAKAGSIAEASLMLNKVFETAQSAADTYVENVRRLQANGPPDCETSNDEASG